MGVIDMRTLGGYIDGYVTIVLSGMTHYDTMAAIFTGKIKVFSKKVNKSAKRSSKVVAEQKVVHTYYIREQIQPACR